MLTLYCTSDDAVGDHRIPGMGTLSLWGVDRVRYFYQPPDVVTNELVLPKFLSSEYELVDNVLQASEYCSFLACDWLKWDGG